VLTRPLVLSKVDEESKAGSLREAWVARVLASLSTSTFVRPRRLGRGSTMTVAMPERGPEVVDQRAAEQVGEGEREHRSGACRLAVDEDVDRGACRS
jgi:hypothetical protein